MFCASLLLLLRYSSRPSTLSLSVACVFVFVFTASGGDRRRRQQRRRRQPAPAAAARVSGGEQFTDDGAKRMMTVAILKFMFYASQPPPSCVRILRGTHARSDITCYAACREEHTIYMLYAIQRSRMRPRIGSKSERACDHNCVTLGIVQCHSEAHDDDVDQLDWRFFCFLLCVYAFLCSSSHITFTLQFRFAVPHKNNVCVNSMLNVRSQHPGTERHRGLHRKCRTNALRSAVFCRKICSTACEARSVEGTRIRDI